MRNENYRIFSFAASVVWVTILCGVVQKLPAQTKDVNPKANAGNEVTKMSDTRGFYCNTKALNKTENERIEPSTC